MLEAVITVEAGTTLIGVVPPRLVVERVQG